MFISQCHACHAVWHIVGSHSYLGRLKHADKIAKGEHLQYKDNNQSSALSQSFRAWNLEIFVCIIKEAIVYNLPSLPIWRAHILNSLLLLKGVLLILRFIRSANDAPNRGLCYFIVTRYICSSETCRKRKLPLQL